MAKKVSVRLLLLTLPLIALQMTALTQGTFCKTFLNTSVPTSIVYKNTSVTKQCECRRLCQRDDTCTGVTVTPHTLGGTHNSAAPHNCLFIASVSRLPHYEGLVTPLLGAMTFFKQMPCGEQFEHIEELGCVHKSRKSFAYNETKLACPAGSGLFSPGSVHAFRLLRQHLQGLGGDAAPFYWVGIEKLAKRGVWQWRSGGYIGELKTSPYWQRGEPNNRTACAGLGRGHRRQEDFKLADDDCSAARPYICQQL